MDFANLIVSLFALVFDATGSIFWFAVYRKQHTSIIKSKIIGEKHIFPSKNDFLNSGNQIKIEMRNLSSRKTVLDEPYLIIEYEIAIQSKVEKFEIDPFDKIVLEPFKYAKIGLRLTGCYYKSLENKYFLFFMQPGNFKTVLCKKLREKRFIKLKEKDFVYKKNLKDFEAYKQIKHKDNTSGWKGFEIDFYS